MTPLQLRERTHAFAVSVVRFCITLRARRGALPIADHLQRSAMSTAANYRAVCRAHTKPTFIAKLSIVVEEADETVGWLKMLEGTGLAMAEELAPYQREATELLAIFVASRRTASRS